jgi:two-component system chemotaxis response regulator CheB
VRVAAAVEGDPIRRGEVRVAVPDLHLMLDPGRMRVVRAPRENRYRPAIDALFRSAALAYGPRVTGIVLTGLLDDGAAGLWSIKARGGTAIVQDPADAEFGDMPRNALEVVAADHVLPLRDIAPLLVRIAREAAPVAEPPAPALELEVDMIANDNASMEKMDRLGSPSKLTCPECGGALWEMHEPPTRFRCHVGHGYSLRTLFAEQTLNIEAALWAALRALEQGSSIARRLSDQARHGGRPQSAQAFIEQAQDSEHHAAQIRELLDKGVQRPSAAG